MDKEIREHVAQIKRERDETTPNKEAGLVFVGESITLEQAISRLIKELQKDKTPGSYFYTWQSNIAMAFYNACREHRGPFSLKDRRLAEIANAAAINFLNSLCSQNKNTMQQKPTQ
jgi:hypothetical protein